MNIIEIDNKYNINIIRMILGIKKIFLFNLVFLFSLYLIKFKKK